MERKIHTFGGYSHLVTLPPEWIEANGFHLKDNKIVDMQIKNNRVIISAKSE